MSDERKEQGQKAGWLKDLLDHGPRDAKGRILAELTQEQKDLLACDITRYFIRRPMVELADAKGGISIRIPNSTRDGYDPKRQYIEPTDTVRHLRYVPKGALVLWLDPSYRTPDGPRPEFNTAEMTGPEKLANDEFNRMGELLQRLLNHQYHGMVLRPNDPKAAIPILIFSSDQDQLHALEEAGRLLELASEVHLRGDPKEVRAENFMPKSGKAL